MRATARRIVRAAAFGLLRTSRSLERLSARVVVASLTRSEVEALIVAEWEAFGERDAVFETGLFDWEKHFFARHIGPSDSVLVVGAGGGRDVFPLVEAGHAVTAMDIAPGALEALRARAASLGRDVPTLCASIANADFSGRTFDVVLFSWFCFAYLQGPAERRSALERSAAALRPGGRILLSYPLRTGEARPPRYAGMVARMARLLGGVEAENADAYNVTGTAARPGIFFTHPFTFAEIEDEARRAGLITTFHGRSLADIGVAVIVPRRPEAVP